MRHVRHGVRSPGRLRGEGMSDNGLLKFGDFPQCPVCCTRAGYRNEIERVRTGEFPIDPSPSPIGTGLFKKCYEDEVFLGPLPDIEIMTQLGFKTKFLPGIMQMAPLIHPTKPPLAGRHQDQDAAGHPGDLREVRDPLDQALGDPGSHGAGPDAGPRDVSRPEVRSTIKVRRSPWAATSSSSGIPEGYDADEVVVTLRRRVR